MDTATRRRMLRHIRTRRFDRVVELLGDVHAAASDDRVGAAVDAARRCQGLAVDLQGLRATAADVAGEIECEVADILGHLDLTGLEPVPAAQRWWQRLRTLTRAPPHAGGDDDADVDRQATTRHLAAYGLGHFEVLVGGVPVTGWKSLRGQAVLKVLLVRQGRAVHREELMESLWPGAPYARARNRLNVSIHGLRRSLEAQAAQDLIMFDNDSYRLNADVGVWFDVHEFEERTGRGRRHYDAGYTAAAMSEFRRAVALYTGDLFEDDRDSDWADGTRRRLRAHHRELLDVLGDEALLAGDLRACLHWSERLLDAEPWHEGAHARLMRVHARRGQAQLAIRQFVECARVLRAEVEAMPGRPLIDLYEQIRSGEQV